MNLCGEWNLGSVCGNDSSFKHHHHLSLSSIPIMAWQQPYFGPDERLWHSCLIFIFPMSLVQHRISTVVSRQKWGCFYVQQSHNFHLKAAAPPLGSPVSSHIPRKCKLFFIRKRNSPVTMYYSCPSCKKVPLFILHRSRDFHSTPEMSWAISTEADYSGSALC